MRTKLVIAFVVAIAGAVATQALGLSLAYLLLTIPLAAIIWAWGQPLLWKVSIAMLATWAAFVVNPDIGLVLGTMIAIPVMIIMVVLARTGQSQRVPQQQEATRESAQGEEGELEVTTSVQRVGRENPLKVLAQLLSVEQLAGAFHEGELRRLVIAVLHQLGLPSNEDLQTLAEEATESQQPEQQVLVSEPRW